MQYDNATTYATSYHCSVLMLLTISQHYYTVLAVITRPPDGVQLPPAALAARRLRRLASLLEL